VSAPYIQGLIHDGDGHTTQFLLDANGYRQWGWTGRGNQQEAYAANVDLLTLLSDAAEQVKFFDDPEEEARYLGATKS